LRVRPRAASRRSSREEDGTPSSITLQAVVMVVGELEVTRRRERRVIAKQVKMRMIWRVPILRTMILLVRSRRLIVRRKGVRQVKLRVLAAVERPVRCLSIAASRLQNNRHHHHRRRQALPHQHPSKHPPNLKTQSQAAENATCLPPHKTTHRNHHPNRSLFRRCMISGGPASTVAKRSINRSVWLLLGIYLRMMLRG